MSATCLASVAFLAWARSERALLALVTIRSFMLATSQTKIKENAFRSAGSGGSLVVKQTPLGRPAGLAAALDDPLD
jgi:hypothetical protein